MKNINLLLLIMVLLLAPIGLAATTLDQPAASSDQKQNGVFTITATANQGASWMQILYAIRGATSNSTLFNKSIVTATKSWSNSTTLPNTFGNYKFCVVFNGSQQKDCNADIQLKQFEASESSEVVGDFLIKFGIGILNLIAVVAILVLVVYMKGKTKGLGSKF